MSRFAKDDFVPSSYLEDLLGIGASAAATMRRKGTGPAFFRLNQRPYYRISDIEQWIDAGRVAGSEINVA